MNAISGYVSLLNCSVSWSANHTSKSSPFLPEHSAHAHSDTQITSTSCGVEGGGGDEGIRAFRIGMNSDQGKSSAYHDNACSFPLLCIYIGYIV